MVNCSFFVHVTREPVSRYELKVPAKAKLNLGYNGHKSEGKFFNYFNLTKTLLWAIKRTSEKDFLYVPIINNGNIKH